MFLRSLLFSVLLLTACASSHGFHRDEIHATLVGAKPETDDAEIAKAFAQRPQLPKPFRIGVYFREPEAKEGTPLWRWTAQDKEKVLTGARKLQDAHEVSQVFELASSLTRSGDMRSLRLAAAKHGADALLIVSGTNETDSYNNKLAWTYVGLLPALFVHGNETDVLFVTRATLWDVRNEYLYLSAEAEGERKESTSVAGLDEKKVVLAAKDESLAKLHEELEKMSQGLVSERQASR
jgi:hypothetical protein